MRLGLGFAFELGGPRVKLGLEEVFVRKVRVRVSFRDRVRVSFSIRVRT